jgi:hypothetical protein
VAINGLGKIGRAALKIILDTPELNLVAANDVATMENLAYLLRYDTVYGRYDKPVETSDTGYDITNAQVGEQHVGRGAAFVLLTDHRTVELAEKYGKLSVTRSAVKYELVRWATTAQEQVEDHGQPIKVRIWITQSLAAVSHPRTDWRHP